MKDILTLLGTVAGIILFTSIGALITRLVRRWRNSSLVAWAKANGGDFQPNDPGLLATFAGMCAGPFREGQNPRYSGHAAQDVCRLTLHGHALTVFDYTYGYSQSIETTNPDGQGNLIRGSESTWRATHWRVIAVELPASRPTLQLLGKEEAAQDSLIAVPGMRRLPVNDPNLAQIYGVIGDNETFARDMLQTPAVAAMLARSPGCVLFEGHHALTWMEGRPISLMVQYRSNWLTELLSHIPPSVWHTPYPA